MQGICHDIIEKPLRLPRTLLERDEELTTEAI